MSISRKRRKPGPPRASRRSRHVPRPEHGASCIALDPRSFSRDIESLLTRADIEQMRLCMEAEAGGDAERALHHYRRGPHVLGSPHGHHLHELVDLGADAPRWAHARWALGQAHRWMLAEQDPRIRDAVIQTLVVAYPDVDLEQPLGLDLTEFCTRVAASDWICEQLAVFAYGGLADFLDVKAGDGLLARADRVRAWADVTMGGYRLGGVDRDRLLVTDLGNRESLELLNLGALTGRPAGVCVLGRVVPVDVPPGLMFESRPLDVPCDVAVRVAGLVAEQGPAAWTVAVGDARAEHRLPRFFSAGLATTLTSDLLPESWGADPGQDEANGLRICQLAVSAARHASWRGAAAAAPHLFAVLVDSGVHAAVQEQLVEPAHAQAWQLLAGCVPEPVRSRAVELARLCRLRAVS